MRSDKYLLIGPLAPPATGQSVSFEMLVKGVAEKGFDCFVVNLARRGASSASRFSWRRATEMMAVFGKTIRGLWGGYHNVYITIAQSAAGFVRDCIMVWSARGFSAHIVVHLHGGNYGGFYHFLLDCPPIGNPRIVVVDLFANIAWSGDGMDGDNCR